MKLIVGLGNPGPEYADTRHNIGFKVAEEIARRHRVTFKTTSKWKARTARIAERDDDLLLAEPTTFMNLSGWAVQAIMSFHKLESSDLLVIVDDADLPVGRLRIRGNGSAGGHNGLKSVIQELGTQEFSRLRVGVGRDQWTDDLRDHVLGRFQPAEQEPIELAVKRAADAAEMFATDGIIKAMNTYNAPEPNHVADDQT